MYHWSIQTYDTQIPVSNTSQHLSLSDLSPEEIKNAGNELIPEKDGTFSIKPAYAAGLFLQHPKLHHYNGKVYFLNEWQ